MEINSRYRQYRSIERTLKSGVKPRAAAKKHGYSLEVITSVLFWLLDGRPSFAEFNYGGRMGHHQDRAANVARVNELYSEYRSTLKAA